jgi:phosphate/sulfate permease
MESLTMPARVVFYLVLIALVAGGLTVLAAQLMGFPMALAGLLAAGLALGLRLWLMRR